MTRPLLGVLAVSVFFCSTLVPAQALALEPDEARHLLTRTGFSPSLDEIEALRPMTRGEAVRKCLDGVRTRSFTEPPEWAEEPPPDRAKLREATEEERRALDMERRRRGADLKGWWILEMVRTDSPLTERMTLFWHNHFTSSLRKVGWPGFLHRQNALLRKHACGNFATLLREVSRDPAMVIYLDGAANRKGKPNENFSRELLELFTLGEGHYTEADIREAARAFTGWTIDRAKGVSRFRPRLHDDGEKTVLGAAGRLDGDGVIDAVLARERTAVFIVEKLWREFVSPELDPEEIARLARLFRDSGYEMKPLLSALFAADPFWADENRGTLVKSPVELLVGTVRAFRIPVREGSPLVAASRLLGQDLFDPPNVKGWPGGTAWIDATTLLGRHQLLERMVRGSEERGGRGEMRRGREGRGGREKRGGPGPDAEGLDAGRWLGDGEAPSPEILRRLLLPIDPVNPLPETGELRVLLERLVLDPAYQLK